MLTGWISLQIQMFRLIYRSLHPLGCMPWINILHLWGFLCVRDAGRRGNKITVSIIDFNRSSIQIFKQCDNWLWKRFNWLLWEKSKIPHYNQWQNWLRHFQRSAGFKRKKWSFPFPAPFIQCCRCSYSVPIRNNKHLCFEWMEGGGVWLCSPKFSHMKTVSQQFCC